ncbi:mobA domain protein [Acinetobacter baumannii 756476]|nr:mobA domain protein [Acinetobacter baumannii 756476]
MYYLNHLAKKAKNKKELEQDFNEIIKTQKPKLQDEHWNLSRMDNQLQNSLCYPDPQVDFKPLIGLKLQMEAKPVIQENKVSETIRPSTQPKPKNNDYDFGGP